ncbi:hypothetical protein ACFWH4_18050 [Streptomyces sp. NPDC127091]|uniref:hypothetical protein n=1 Tax=Streptomyces TaxID=1883 RepID=UPI0036698EEB
MRRPPLTLELLATPAAVSGVRRALRDYGVDVQLCASGARHQRDPAPRRGPPRHRAGVL